ncbi:HtaA domain-containing protein [Streptomyces sp. NPDC056323]|uniref:HtaA domain-containing protein n=1 Tax=Streptomyces sp. NPDC056323 TaxID=3345784 RepID=UPI0035E090E0
MDKQLRSPGRRRVLTAGVALAALALAVPATAALANVVLNQITKGDATITMTDAARSELAAHHVTVTASGEATDGQGVTFPVVEGELDLTLTSGSVKFAGGLTFRRDDGLAVTFADPVVDLDSEGATATVDGGAQQLPFYGFDSRDFSIDVSLTSLSARNIKMAFSKEAVDRLNTAFGTQFTAGEQLATATGGVEFGL